MLDIGWSELAIVAVIVLIVVGPKDLPRVLRIAGQWAGKARRIAREFQSNIDDMIRESELDEVKRDVETASRFDVKKDLENTIDPKGDVKAAFEAPVEGDSDAAQAKSAVASSPAKKFAPEPKLPEAGDAGEPEPAPAGAKAADAHEPDAEPLKTRASG